MSQNLIGMQTSGLSPDFIKTMAINAFASATTTTGDSVKVLADVGCGAGLLSRELVKFNKEIIMVDYDTPPTLPSNKCSFFQADLNNKWPISDNAVDFLFSLEVIEHVENPRFFFNEIKRVIKPGGFGFISTPNNESFFSKFNFVFRNQHRYFQDSCYPGHITPLLHIDLLRILSEKKLDFKGFYYSNDDVVPFVNFHIKGSGKSFSGNFGVLFQKN